LKPAFITFEWWVSSPPERMEYNLQKLITSSDKIYNLCYGAKDITDSEKKRAIWEKAFKDARIKKDLEFDIITDLRWKTQSKRPIV
jgi:hypothetical protein